MGVNLKLTETDEDGIDSHGVDAEEDARDEKGAENDRDDGHEIVVGAGHVRIEGIHSMVKDVEGANTNAGDDDQSAE